jgi:hypothetical protein
MQLPEFIPYSNQTSDSSFHLQPRTRSPTTIQTPHNIFVPDISPPPQNTTALRTTLKPRNVLHVDNSRSQRSLISKGRYIPHYARCSPRTQYLHTSPKPTTVLNLQPQAQPQRFFGLGIGITHFNLEKNSKIWWRKNIGSSYLGPVRGLEARPLPGPRSLR